MEALLEILHDINPDVDYETCENLIGDGHLTSFDIVMLVSNISQELDVTIPANEIIPENFESAKTIYALIQKLEED